MWLELGLQSAFDETLAKVNRGHGFAEYADSVYRTRDRGLKVCTHLIAGLPGETAYHVAETLRRVLELGTDGLKLHPLHVVKGTQLANAWRQGEYQPLTLEAYVNIAADLVGADPLQRGLAPSYRHRCRSNPAGPSLVCQEMACPECYNHRTASTTRCVSTGRLNGYE